MIFSLLPGHIRRDAAGGILEYALKKTINPSESRIFLLPPCNNLSTMDKTCMNEAETAIYISYNI